MFGVGLHFSLKDLLSVRAIAVPGALAQGLVATPLGMALGWLLGWPLGAGIIFGIALSVASTVVLLRVLQERRLLETERGRITVGWLIVQDIAMVLVLVLLPGLAALFHGVETAPEMAEVARSVGHRARQVRLVHRRDADRRQEADPGDPALCRPYRQPRAVPACRAVDRARRGLRRGRAVRHLARARRVLCRHDAERVAIEPAGRHRVAAVARRLRGAVLRLGRHAVRPGDPGRRAVGAARDRAHHHGRQVGRRLYRGAAVQALALGGADDHRLAGADRRVLVHPRQSQPTARAAAGGGPRPHPRRRHHQHPAQSAAVRRARYLRRAPREGAGRTGGRRPGGGGRGGADARADPPHQPQGPCGAGRPWPGRQLYQLGAQASGT